MKLKKGREEIAAKYTKELDGFTGDVVVSKEKIETAAKLVPQKLKDDIHFAHERIKRFAEAQKKFN